MNGWPLCLPSGPDTYLDNVTKAMQVIGIDHEQWDLAELEERMPYLLSTSYSPPKRIDDDTFGQATGRLTGGLYTKHTGYMDDPQLSARNLSDAAQRDGAEFLWNAEVASLTYDPTGTAVTGVVLSDGVRVEAPVVVNAAGPHSSGLNREAFGAAQCQVEDDSVVDSRPFRVEVAVVPAPNGVDFDGGDHTMPWVADNDLGIYYRPQFPGQLLVGGAEPDCDPKHFLDRPEDMDGSFTEEWSNYVHRAGLRINELPIPNSARGLVAMYDAADDWLPIYDKSALTGLYSMRGTSGNQFKNAPVVGKVIKGIIEATEAGHDHDAEPVQLELEHTGHTLNTGTWSRLRDNPDTSGTVLG